MNDSSATGIPFVSGNIIAASAGTGKTYQLTSRFLALLAMGEDPGSMAALTFTKKAAGEFRNRIFKALADGALNRHEPHDDPDRNPLAVRIMETLSGLRLDTSREEWTVQPAGNTVPLLPATDSQPGADALVRRICEEHNAAPHSRTYPENVCRDALHLPDNLTSEYFCKLLDKLVKAVNRLSLSTLDSFFQKLVVSHCFDVGVSGISPVTGEELQKARRDATHALLDAMRKAPAEFYQLYRDITEDRMNDMMGQLQDNVQVYLDQFRRIPYKSRWGNADIFNLDDERILFKPEVPFNHAYIDSVCDRIESLLAIFAPGAPVTNALLKLRDAVKARDFAFGKLFSQWLANGPVDPGETDDEEKKRQARQEKEVWELAVGLVADAQRDMVRGTLLKTERMYDLMACYDASYEQSILGSGRFTFDDITRKAYELLSDNGNPTETGLDLNQRLRHWMLDEFQDTNREQMKTLDALLQDALQTDDYREFPLGGHTYHAAQSSLFVVGDVKQSIYSFRGGTPEILREMLPAQDGTPPDSVWGRVMAFSPLQKSFRSSPVIMGEDGFINALFNGIRYSAEFYGQRDDLLALTPDFSSHCSAKSGMPGYVRISLLPENADMEATRGAMCAEISRIIRAELLEHPDRPAALKGDMSVGILLRKNDDVHALYRHLRAAFGTALPLQMVSEDFVALDSPMGELMLSFFLWLCHPADPHRRAIVLASPLGEAACGPLPRHADLSGLDGQAVHRARDAYDAELEAALLRASSRWLDELDALGYSRVVRHLLELLGDDVERSTARDWVQAAQDFDAAGGSLDEWILFIRQLSVQGNPSPRCIQIMTMHKSKGLEFDAVILPYLSYDGIDSTSRMQYLLNEGKDAILLSPGSEANRIGMPEIAPFVDLWKARRRLEEYNLLYVAATRARRANYILLHGKSKPFKWDTKSKQYCGDGHGRLEPSRSMGGIIMRALGIMMESGKRMQPWDCEEVYAIGAPDWMAPLVERKAARLHEREAAERSLPQVGLLPGTCQTRLVSPSKLAEDAMPADTPEFRTLPPAPADGRSAADFGTAVHALFEQVEWLEDGAPLPFAPGDSAEAGIVCAALQDPGIAALFQRIGDQVAYAEQDIDAIDTLNGKEVWVSGTIDRLVLTMQGGTVAAASIIDFKTDKRRGPSREEQDTALRERHFPQMKAYHNLVCTAFNLPSHKVTVTLVSCPANAASPRAIPYPPDTQW